MTDSVMLDPPQAPTAAQNWVLVHETEASVVLMLGPTCAASSMVQVVPFHNSVSGK
jgi:hypothetical protein